MIIGFDGTILREPRTGIGYYTYFLIRHLKLLNADLDPQLYDGLRMRRVAFPADGSGQEDGTTRPVSSAVTATLRRSTMIRAVWRRLKGAGFRRAVRGVDLFHATNYLPPQHTNVPVLPLIHDVSHLRFPQWHPMERVKWLETRVHELHNAPLINTVSRFSAREISETLGIARERIHVTYPGVNPVYRQSAPPDPTVLTRFDVKAGRYFLCVGTLEPRKNIATAIQAYAQLSRNYQNSYPLVIVGPEGWGDLGLPSATEMLRQRGVLRFVGYLDEWSMRTLYRACTAFLFPSQYEGFGMPVSEAMATGSRPVIAAGGATEEVAGAHGVALPAHDPDAWSLGLLRAIDEDWHADMPLRHRLIDASSGFSWGVNAQETMRLYHRLLDDRKDTARHD